MPAGGCDGAEHAIADEMSIGVVDGLEVVDIEHQDTEWAFGTDGARVFLAKSGEPEAPVVGIGQRIDGSQPLESIMSKCVVNGQPEIRPETFKEMLGIRVQFGRGRQHHHAERHPFERDGAPSTSRAGWPSSRESTTKAGSATDSRTVVSVLSARRT